MSYASKNGPNVTSNLSNGLIQANLRAYAVGDDLTSDDMSGSDPTPMKTSGLEYHNMHELNFYQYALF